MADIARMESALRNAHAAGDTAAAKQIANALKATMAQPQTAPNGVPLPAPGVDHTQHRARLEEEKLRDLSKIGTIGGFNPASAIAEGATFGFADELSSAINTPFRAVRDRVGLSEAYKRELALQNQQRNEMQESAPVMSATGEFAGAIGTGAGLAGRGLSLLGRTAGKGLATRAAAGAAEGAAYGAAYGAGKAEQGERLEGAQSGAVTGALLGGAVPVVGAAARKAVDGSRQSRAASQFAKSAPMADDLAAQESALFDAARQSGVSVKPQAMDRLIDNMTLAAGRRNDALRAKTAGMLDDLQSMRGQRVDVQSLHELRQEVGAAMSSADAQDVRTLTSMKKVLDGFIDNADTSKVDGGVEGLKTLRQALDVSARRFKTEKIDQLLDLADVRTGQYSQSGAVNALRAEASKLYKQISSGRAKGFTAGEVALIRSLAKVETQSAANKLLSKFAPRGVVSTGMGAIAGAATMGPVGAAIPMVLGAAAARGADKGALQAAQTLRAMAATGRSAPQMQSIIPRNISPRLVPAAGMAGGILSSQ